MNKAAVRGRLRCSRLSCAALQKVISAAGGPGGRGRAGRRGGWGAGCRGARGGGLSLFPLPLNDSEVDKTGRSEDVPRYLSLLLSWRREFTFQD